MNLANHLWQSTWCVAAAVLLAHMLRRYGPAIRYRVWLAASLKFLVPFSLLVSAGRLLPMPALTVAPSPSVSTAVQFIGEPFDHQRAPIAASPSDPSLAATLARVSQFVDASAIGRAVVVVWALGAIALVLTRWVRWQKLGRLVRAAAILHDGREMEALARAQRALSFTTPITIRLSSSSLEPGVVGVFRPLILWPAGLSARLTDAELDAILTHELAHVRRRDNLASAIHVLVETVFWFHPLVWWLESRLIDEREHACDETVVRASAARGTYVEGILKVCDFCLPSPLSFVAGIAGSNLTHRVEEIMTSRMSLSLSLGRKTLLAGVAILALVGPVAWGGVAAHASPSTRGVRSGLASGASLLADPFVTATLSAAAIAQAVPPKATPPRAPNPNQTRPSTGSITGVVTDQLGGVLPGATVTMTAPAGSSISVSGDTVSGDIVVTMLTSVTMLTGADGMYSAKGLSPGAYGIRVELAGFKPAAGTIQVTSGQDARGDVQLLIGSVTETVNAAKESTAQTSTAGAPAALQQRADQAPPPPPPPGAVRVGGDIKEPKKIRDVRPVYPPDALAAGVTGMVIIEAKIGTDGSVQDAMVLRSIPMLDQAALDAVRQWVFTPTTLSGTPVEVWMTVTVNFTLDR